MHECTSIIINSFFFLRRNLFNKELLWTGDGVLRERMKTNRARRGEESSPMRDQALSLCSLCQKNCLIFQTAKRVPSNKMLGGS